MFKNYLVVSLRHLQREKVYAGINILGLGIATACVLLVFLYVRREYSFDAYHEKADRIYRLAEYRGSNEKRWEADVSGNPVSVLRASIPDVEQVASMLPLGSPRVKLNGYVFRTLSAVFVEPELFDIFSFSLIEGDPKTALIRPNTAILSASTARKAFGHQSPIGKTFSFLIPGGERQIEITGVMEDIPSNSHFRYDLFFSFETLKTTPVCTDCGSVVFALLKQGANPAAIGRQVLNHIRTVDGKDFVSNVRLVPLQDVYFSGLPVQFQGDRRYIYILSSIAFGILLIACANYMNLATARSARRAKEVGIRKTVGARYGQLARQFLTEGLLLAILALPVAFLLLHVYVPLFNRLSGSDVSFDWSAIGPVLPVCVAILAIIGLLGGSYPALYLSAFRPIDVLKGRSKGRSGAVYFRRSLVVVQFVASIILIAATITVLRQLHYVQNKKLGFDADQVVMVQITTPELFQIGATLKDEFLRNPGVLNGTAGYSLPGAIGFSMMSWTNPLGDDGPRMTLKTPVVDGTFLETMHIPLLAGRNIKDGPGTPDALEALINRKAIHALGWKSDEEAIGKRIGPAVVVGVVGDFNFESLHVPVEPVLLMQNQNRDANVIGLRIEGATFRQTLAGLERTWKRLAPAEPFEYSFLRDEMNVFYEKENRTARIFGIFAGLAVLLAGMGLFGLAAFSAEQRTKEMGIRKVFGASIPGLVFLLARDFLILVGIGFVAALPVIYVTMTHWLRDFAYHITIGPSIFLLSGLAALVITLASVGYQAFRAARTNPVVCLRYE